MWCRLVQFAESWCTACWCSLVQLGVDWCNMVQFGATWWSLVQIGANFFAILAKNGHKKILWDTYLHISQKIARITNFKSWLSLIVWVNVVLNRTVVVDSDWGFDNLCGSHLQSQSELYDVRWWYYTLVIDLIGQLHCDVFGRVSVKLWCYWLWRLVM